MIDFAGEEVQLGNTVVYACNKAGRQTSLTTGKVLGFTRAKVRLDYPKGDIRTILKSSRQITIKRER